MEIRATGLVGLSAATSSAIVGDGEAAFAAVLGKFGVNRLGPNEAEAVNTGLVSSDAAFLTGSNTLPAEGSPLGSDLQHAPGVFPGLSAIAEATTTGSASRQAASFIHDGPFSGGIGGQPDTALPGQPVPVVTGEAAPVVSGQGAVTDENEIGWTLPQALPIDQGLQLSNLNPDSATRVGPSEVGAGLLQEAVREKDIPRPGVPVASTALASSGSVVAPEVAQPAGRDQPRSVGKPATALEQPLSPDNRLPDAQASGPSVPKELADAPIAGPAEAMEITPPRSEPPGQLQSIPDDSLTGLKIAPAAHSNAVAQAPIAASAQPSQIHSRKVASLEAKGGAPGDLPQIQPAASEAIENPSVASGMASEPADEAFTRATQNATPERVALHSNTAIAPLPPVQPGGQAVVVPPSALGLGADAPAPPLPTPLPSAPAAQAEVAPMVSFQADKVAREMGIQIARRVASGGDELVIRLDPAELGRINIRMSVNEQGQLRAIVAADVHSVVEAIRSDISELSRALEQAGVRTDSQSFRFDRGGNGDPGGQWQPRYQQQNSANRNGDSSGLSMAEDETAYRPLAMNGRINMMA